jgi:hypothetical protein
MDDAVMEAYLEGKEPVLFCPPFPLFFLVFPPAALRACVSDVDAPTKPVVEKAHSV